MKKILITISPELDAKVQAKAKELAQKFGIPKVAKSVAVVKILEESFNK